MALIPDIRGWRNIVAKKCKIIKEYHKKLIELLDEFRLRINQEKASI